MPDRRAPSSVIDRLKRFDRNLDLRWCQDRWGVYHKGARIGSVHHELLGDGSGLISKLYHTDIFRQHGSAEKAATFLEQAERTEKRDRDWKRKQEFVDQSKDAYDELARLNGRRINSSGMPGQEKVSAGEAFVSGPAQDRKWS